MALATADTVVYFVAGLDERFDAEFACCHGNQVASSFDFDSNTSFLVSVSDVFDAFLCSPAGGVFG